MKVKFTFPALSLHYARNEAHFLPHLRIAMRP